MRFALSKLRLLLALVVLAVTLAACADEEPAPPQAGLQLFLKGFTVSDYTLSFAPGARQGGEALRSPAVQALERQLRQSLDNRLRILPSERTPATLDIEITRLTYATEEAQERLGADSSLTARVRVFGPDGSVIGERGGLSVRFDAPDPDNGPGLSVAAGAGSRDDDGGNDRADVLFTIAILALGYWLEAQEAAAAPALEERPSIMAQDFTNTLFEWLTF
jgi:hypothetical protein